ncbi:MAG: PaaI family thioesterase [candidate division WOR-3 bacterium]
MDNKCFACGGENEKGLKLKITETADGVISIIRLPSDYQGYSAIAHGGIIATILDEMAVWAAYKSGYKSATCELNVRIKKPMYIGQEYIARGWVIEARNRLVKAGAELKDRNSESIVASACVKLIRID